MSLPPGHITIHVGFLICLCSRVLKCKSCIALAARHLPDKAIDLVDEACANVRVQLDSQPEEIDVLERKRIQLEVELHALEKEKDKASKARLQEVIRQSLL